MRVFVTGGSGLLGGNLVAALDASGHEVKALARSLDKARLLLPNARAAWVKGDLGDVAGFAPALDGCDALCHTAAYHREFYNGAGSHRAVLRQINVDATLRLAEEAQRRGIRRFVHISSCGVLGAGRDGAPGDEQTPPLPVELRNAYFRSKLEADRALETFVAHSALELVTILPAWMWGPGDAAPSPAGRLVLDFLDRKIPGIMDGGQSLVDARDVALGVVAALERGVQGRYIVAGTYHSVRDVLEGLERVSGIPAPRIALPHAAVMGYALASELFGRATGHPVLLRPDAVRALHAKLRWSSDKAVRELGIGFRSLDETLRDTVRWLREQRSGRAA